ncbi:NAD(P)H-binding protein [soil metagenome]
MKLAIFGATGGTGQQVVEQALAAGHSVVALVRDPAKVTTQHPHLTLIQGNVLELADVVKTVNMVDGVICSLGNTANNPAMVVSAGTQNIVQGMRQKGVKRLIVISSLGVGDSKNQVGWLFKLIMWTFLRKAIRDKEEQEKLVRASGLEWTIIRPGGLVDGPRTGHYKASLDPSFMASRVVRADVAEFALSQLTDPIYLRKTPAIIS